MGFPLLLFPPIVHVLCHVDTHRLGLLNILYISFQFHILCCCQREERSDNEFFWRIRLLRIIGET